MASRATCYLLAFGIGALVFGASLHYLAGAGGAAAATALAWWRIRRLRENSRRQHARRGATSGQEPRGHPLLLGLLAGFFAARLADRRPAHPRKGER